MTKVHEYAALKALVKSDAEYAWALFCNLTMPIKDSYAPVFGAATVFGWATSEDQHKWANEAAAYLMQHLWDYDVTQHERYKYGKSGAQSYAEFRIAMDEAEDEDIAVCAHLASSSHSEQPRG